MDPIDNNRFYFQGVDVESMIHVEDCFKINSTMYNKTENGVCSILRQSLSLYGDSMNLSEIWVI